MKFENMVKLVSKHLKDIERVRSLVPQGMEDAVEVRDDVTEELFRCLPRKVVEVFAELTECGESLCVEFRWAMGLLESGLTSWRDPAYYFRHWESGYPWEHEVEAATKELLAKYPQPWRCDAKGPASRARIVVDNDGKKHITNN